MTGTRHIARFLLAGLLLTGTVSAADAPAEIARGTAALYRGDFAAAYKIGRNYIMRHPNEAAGRILIGQVLMGATQYERAFAQFHEALRLEPENVDALYFLGKVTMILGQIEFEALRRMAPDSARVHQILGEAHRLEGAPEKAKEEFLAGLKADPQSTDLLNALGDLNRERSHCDKAIPYYERARKIQPRNYDSVYGLGACYLLGSQLDRAIELLRSAVSIDPGSAAARFALGRALMENKQLDQAVAELKKVTALEPEMGEGFFLLGRVYRAQGREQEAKEAFRRSRELLHGDMLGNRSRTGGSDLLPDGGSGQRKRQPKQ